MADVVLTSSGAVSGADPDDLLPELTDPEFAYTAPGVIRRLPAPQGDGHDFDDVVMTGRFKTTDDRNDPSLLFITAYRRGPNGGEPGETFRFYDGYGIAVMPLNGQSAIDGRNNIFVVHNSTAVRTVVLDKVIHTGWGDAAYLASVSESLDPDTWYAFRLRYLTNGGLEFYLAEEGSPFPGTPTISWGAYQHGMTDEAYYGMASNYSDGEQWSFEDFYISYYTSRYPVAFFELDATEFPEKCYVIARAYATGWDDGTGTPDAPGIKMWGYNYSTETWDLLDSHTNKPGTGELTLYSDALAMAEYRSPADDYIRIVLIGDYPSSFADENDSYLFIDTVYAENWSTDFAHIGGKADIYLKDSTQMVQHTMDIYNVDSIELLIPDNAHITTGLARPIMWITSMELIDGGGSGTGVFLTEGVDYSFDVTQYPEYRYSAREMDRLLFEIGIVGSNVRVTFWTYDNIEAAQDYIDNPSRRNSTDDVIARTCNPWRISSLVLDYRGSLSDAEIRQLVVDYILGSAGSTLTWNEIEDYINAQDNVLDLNIESWQVDEYANNGDITIHTDEDDLTLDDPTHQMWAILVTDISFTAGSD
jgi:hypothetical protein